MPFIRTIAHEEATGETRRLYDEAVERAGRLFHVVQIQGLYPEAMEASIDLYKTLMMGRGPLRRAVREMLAVVVSRELECFYWTEAHGEDLRVFAKDDALVEQVKKDYRQADLDGKTRALMDFAVQVTREQHTVAQATLDAVRAAGWNDEEILHAVHVIGFFNYYTRMVDALGVEPEDFMKRG